MRTFLPAIALAVLVLTVLAGASACANFKTYQTQLNVCQSANGLGQSATITKSSGDPEVDAYALKQVPTAVAYAADASKPCHHLTVEYRSVGEKQS
jgi:hypothetical protein